jgi:hypothetical protein
MLDPLGVTVSRIADYEGFSVYDVRYYGKWIGQLRASKSAMDIRILGLKTDPAGQLLSNCTTAAGLIEFIQRHETI